MDDTLGSVLSPAPRPSACPGLLRIVPALDGGICRIKLACGCLEADQAHAIGEAASRHASGVIELTNRSNLQLRGVRTGHEAPLIAALLAAGLGPSTPGADDVRNLLVSPAMGLDANSEADVAAVAKAILELLQARPAFHSLSPKFALQLDGGERLAMLDHPHDLWLALMPGGTRLAFGLAGCPTDAPLAAVPLEQAPALVEAALALFLELAQPEQTRMRHLLANLPKETFLDCLQSQLAFALPRDPAVLNWRRARTMTTAPLGILAQHQPGLFLLGAMPTLSRLDSSQLHALAELARSRGDGTLRFTPWQSLMLPNVAQAHAAKALRQLGMIGLHIDDSEPLTGLIACTGSAGCAKGLADTKADALRLAHRLHQGTARPQVHLSGCPRSCAAAHVAPLTLLARPGGRYQLYQRTASGAGLGRLLADSLSIDEAADRLT
ncbi:precorrin-3B synthase [Azotobacter chroococcum]|uniref:precorrin-3B synthase n=1 Tax=Azotobacter chroococcum TaxID=353 RepID=UPI000B5E4F21|nr:precorrin-3B synthase [Azotobacter chroococcum]ASL28813.1 oxidoreductase [Azotobacter chroococcum]